MWSDRYNYYNIQSDESYSREAAAEKIMDLLLRHGLFKQKNHQLLSNTDKIPWVEIILVKTKDGNYASSATKLPFINLIAIVCSKGEHIDQQIYIKTFLEVAEELDWKLYLEEDDDGNENIEIKHIN
jgi:hypothetical protein